MLKSLATIGGGGGGRFVDGYRFDIPKITVSDADCRSLKSRRFVVEGDGIVSGMGR